MENGYIKIHRKMLDWEWYRDANTFRLFFHLLLIANWEDSRYMGMVIPRGSCVVGRQKLSLDLGMSERSVRTSLEHLKSTNEITIKTTNKFSVVTITKYDDYQSLIDEKRPAKRPTISPSADHPSTTSKEIKNIKNINNINKENEMTKKIELPFSSEKFSEAWERWKKHRAEIKHKLTPSTEASQLKKLSQFSESEAIAMIDQSIEHGWQGLFPVQRKYTSPIKQTKQGLTGFLTSIDDIEF